jgi:hypothetical protein
MLCALGRSSTSVKENEVRSSLVREMQIVAGLLALSSAFSVSVAQCSQSTTYSYFNPLTGECTEASYSSINVSTLNFISELSSDLENITTGSAVSSALAIANSIESSISASDAAASSRATMSMSEVSTGPGPASITTAIATQTSVTGGANPASRSNTGYLLIAVGLPVLMTLY